MSKPLHDVYLNTVEKWRRISQLTGSTIITAEQRNNIGLSQLKAARQETTDRWIRSGLLDGLNGQVNENLAQLLESPQRQYIGGGEEFNQFAGVTLPVSRRVFANLTANDIVAVQPLGRPIGHIFYAETQFKTNTFRIPKIVGGTIELYMIDLINEWNKFIVEFDGLSFENKSRLDGFKYFTYLKDKLLQYHPNIYVEYCFTSYDYNVYEYVEKQTEYSFKQYLKVKPELKPATTKNGLYYLFYTTPHEIKLVTGSTIDYRTMIDRDIQDDYRRMQLLAGISPMLLPPKSRRTT